MLLNLLMISHKVENCTSRQGENGLRTINAILRRRG